VSLPTLDPDLVFLIDGDHAVRDAVASALRAAGFTVLAFATAEEFLAHGAAGQGCLVVELDLPGMSGLELLDRLASQRPSLPAVLMSARLRPAAARVRRLHPAARLLEKPFGEDDLLALIQATLADPASSTSPASHT
jgi:FixJ family two-component response regulator